MKLSKLIEYAHVSIGQGAPQKIDDFSNEGTPFIRAGSLDLLTTGGSLDSLEFISDDSAKKNRLKLYPINSVVFAKSGMSATKNRVYKLTRPCYVVSHLAILKPKEITHPDYLRLVIQKFKPSTLIKDPAYPSIGQSDIENFKLPFPPLADQTRIAAVLTRAEKLIAQRKASIKALDELLRSTFLEMFGGYLNKREEIFEPIGTVTNFIDYRGKTQNKIESGIPHISAKCVRRGYFDESRLDFITEETYRRIMTRGFPKANDVLFTTEGATMGFVCRVPRFFSKFAVGQRIITLQCKRKLTPEYLEFLLNHSSIQKEIFKRSSGSAAIGIRASEFEEIKIPIPPLPLQAQFAAIVEKVESLKAKSTESLAELENLYGVLSQRAFKGELDLSWAEKELKLSHAEIKHVAGSCRS